MNRELTLCDRAIVQFDRALRTLAGTAYASTRPLPGARIPEPALTPCTRRQSARLMRVNHSGEVCAQALYQGQALTARSATVRQQLERAAQEESDHLAWCETRLTELGGRKSLLNPLWYAGAWAVGVLAGLAGERQSLGLVIATERQVEAHLDDHLAQLSPADLRSRAILGQMKEDEIHHAEQARAAGGSEPPAPVQWVMKQAARLMTQSSFWL